MMRIKHFGLLAVTSIMAFGAIQPTSAALFKEYGYCSYQLMLKGERLEETRVPHFNFQVWARSLDKKKVKKDVSFTAKTCAKNTLKADRTVQHKSCSRNEHLLKDDDRPYGSGVSDFSLVRGRTALFRALCRNHKRKNPNVRPIVDKRQIERLQIYLVPTGGKNACAGNITLYPPRVFKIRDCSKIIR